MVWFFQGPTGRTLFAERRPLSVERSAVGNHAATLAYKGSPLC